MDARLRRHDLVWLPPGAPVELAACSQDAAQAAALARWRAAGRPLVCARGDGLPAGQLRLGLTLPGTGERRRLSITAQRQDVAHHTAPPLLEHLLGELPAALQPPVRALLGRCSALGTAPRVYGSLLWQWLSAQPCLRDGGDIDLLFDLTGAAPAQTDALLQVLREADVGVRLDGELRFGDHAVAWRELAAARSGEGPRRVLAKADNGVALVDLGALLPPSGVAA